MSPFTFDWFHNSTSSSSCPPSQYSVFKNSSFISSFHPQTLRIMSSLQNQSSSPSEVSTQSRKASIAVLVYSTFGHVATLAKSVEDGIKETGADVQVFQFPETLSTEMWVFEVFSHSKSPSLFTSVDSSILIPHTFLSSFFKFRKDACREFPRKGSDVEVKWRWILHPEVLNFSFLITGSDSTSCQFRTKLLFLSFQPSLQLKW